MVSGIILRKFDEHFNFINNLLLKQRNKDVSKFKHIQTIHTPHTKGINSLCLLKDKRLVSAGSDNLITVYNHSYQSQIEIKDAHKKSIWSLCGLRNGYLASASEDKTIKIWRIGDNDYQLIHTLTGHTGWVNKVIELKDGKLSSCSDDHTIKIWSYNKGILSGNYECIQTLKGHTSYVNSIIEMNDCIISGSFDNTLRIWNKSTYQSIQTIQNVYCNSRNGLLKLNEDSVIVGGDNVIYILNIKTFEVNKFEDESLGIVKCLNILKNGMILIGNGNSKGEIYCYDRSSNQIISKLILHKDEISRLIRTEDNYLFSISDKNKIINVYKELYYFEIKR